MGQETKYINPEFLDISIEDFDALKETHKFSKEYKRRKRKMLQEYRKGTLSPERHIYAKLAVAAAILFVVSAPIIVSAANSDFFNRIWGSFAKEDTQPHKETLYDEQELPYEYIFPKREYVDVEPEEAEELIGANVSHKKIVKKLGDTTLTILSSVYDGNAAIVEYTLEREGGVNALEYRQTDNELMGAKFSQDSVFDFVFRGCSEYIFVDLKQSTKEVLHCYDYMVMDPGAYDKKAGGLVLEVTEYPCTKGEMFRADADTFEKYHAAEKHSTLSVSLKEPAGQREFANADGGIAKVSPIAAVIDMHKGLGIPEDGFEDHNDVYYVSIKYKDGTEYVVSEHDLKDVHKCREKIDNSSYITYDMEGNIVLVFNRLVDIGNIESITANKAVHTAKE